MKFCGTKVIFIWTQYAKNLLTLRRFELTMLDATDRLHYDNDGRHRKMRDIGVCAFVFAFAIMLYANTFHHGWVLDDSFLFKDNKFVTAGISGWKDIMMNHSQAGAEFLPETFQYRPVSTGSRQVPPITKHRSGYITMRTKKPINLSYGKVPLYPAVVINT